jgi:hypothetical protein
MISISNGKRIEAVLIMWHDASARGKIFSRAQDGVRGQCSVHLLGLTCRTSGEQQTHNGCFSGVETLHGSIIVASCPTIRLLGGVSTDSSIKDSSCWSRYVTFICLLDFTIESTQNRRYQGYTHRAADETNQYHFKVCNRMYIVRKIAIGRAESLYLAFLGLHHHPNPNP